MKKNLRLLSFLLLCGTVLPLILFSCGSTQSSDTPTTEQKETEPPVREVTLVSAAGSRYAILSDKNDAEQYELARQLYQAIYDATGVGLRLVGPSDSGYEKAIILGNLDHPSVKALLEANADKDLVVGFSGENFVICSPSLRVLTDAVTSFIDTFVKEKNELTIAEQYLYTEVYDRETLYNGITLPLDWPPTDIPDTGREVVSIPYHSSTTEGGSRPDVIDIDIGRQLFVDNFLIESTSLQQTYHAADMTDTEPLFFGWLLDAYYDEDAKVFRVYYKGGKLIHYRESTDGIHWSEQKVALQAASGITNASLIVNHDAAPGDKYKYLLYVRYTNSAYGDTHNPDGTEKVPNFDIDAIPGMLFRSSTGTSFVPVMQLGPGGDTSHLFYNPFREKYVFTLKKDYTSYGRCRHYFECSDLMTEGVYSWKDTVFWQKADSLDLPKEGLGFTPQTYQVTATAYESIMLGAFKMWYGPNNNTTLTTGYPKITDIQLAYSRDGFYFDRPSREPFVASSREEGAWDYGYVHPAPNVCTIVGDELWFFYSAFDGDGKEAYDNPHCAIAKLRRDGFASMDGTGELETRLLKYDDAKKYLFVNAKADSLRAEIVDAHGNVVEGYSFGDCQPFSGDSTCTMLSWTAGNDLSFLDGTNFRIRFRQENGEFYAFWLSETTDGDSNGYNAGGSFSK